MDAAARLCDHPAIAEPPSISDMKARWASLSDPSARPQTVSPGGAATPGQVEAMEETLEILSDQRKMARVRSGRQAVAHADVVALADVRPNAAPVAGGWEVVVVGHVARELCEPGAAAGVVGPMLDAIAAAPTEEGRELGMGLVGVWSARGDTHRVLYAVHQGRRLVTILSVDEP